MVTYIKTKINGLQKYFLHKSACWSRPLLVITAFSETFKNVLFLTSNGNSSASLHGISQDFGPLLNPQIELCRHRSFNPLNGFQYTYKQVVYSFVILCTMKSDYQGRLLFLAHIKVASNTNTSNTHPVMFYIPCFCVYKMTDGS